ncbi:putative ferric-chelate reductase 1 homolog [Thrips palmi]|uniref:Ferric-chelate reductase 1 homolog n=1 Tax=Thrips palmi TaxID=161013 RepID=A0A6P9ACR6_THRPL|nr:putative ferric-chelate reductase 1 homolog [Thrips palmi]
MEGVCVTFLAVAILAVTTLPVARSATVRADASDYVALDGCGASPDRLCLAYPDNCIASHTCTLMATVRPDPAAAANKYLFEMAAQYSGYVAVALSESDLMGVDSVVECIQDPADHTVKLYQSLNKALNTTTGKRGNKRLPAEEQTGVTLAAGKVQNGVIRCSFSRDTVTTVRGKKYDLAKETWYLQAAAGNRLNADTSMHHHTEWVATGSAVSLGTAGLVKDSHGSRRDPPNNNGGGQPPSASAAVLALVAVLCAVRAL